MATLAELQILTRNKMAGAINSLPVVVSRFSGYAAGYSDGTSQSLSYRYRFTPLYNCTGLRLVFGNWSLGTSAGGLAGEVIATNPITISVSFYNISTKVTFNGASSLTIQPGGMVVSDPFPRQFIAGTQYFINIWVSVANSGEKWPLGTTTIAANNEGTFLGDGTGAGTSYTTGAVLGYHPTQILGVPIAPTTKQTVAIAGDSIAAGSSGETIDQGWIRRGLDAQGVPWVRMACGGGTMSTFLGNNTAFGITSIAGVDAIISNFGANDMGAFADFASAQAAYLAHWTKLANMGAKVYACTVLSRNNFSSAQNVIKNAINDLIRSVPAPLSGYIDAADAGDTARGSNTWKTGYSSDGVHPTLTGSTGIAPVITSSMFNF